MTLLLLHNAKGKKTLSPTDDTGQPVTTVTELTRQSMKSRQSLRRRHEKRKASLRKVENTSSGIGKSQSSLDAGENVLLRTCSTFFFAQLAPVAPPQHYQMANCARRHSPTWSAHAHVPVYTRAAWRCAARAIKSPRSVASTRLNVALQCALCSSPSYTGTFPHLFTPKTTSTYRTRQHRHDHLFPVHRHTQ